MVPFIYISFRTLVTLFINQPQKFKRVLCCTSTMLNLNIGILGHVDSGKTSLAKVLSKVASTAAFDKNPQSQERGITLDLGFSSFMIPVPEHLKNQLNDDNIQFTLVDCPGHASLIRTIIGGSQIIDMMLLVIDATKGMQTQTAECLIIGELTCKKMIVVVNKIDLWPIDKRKQLIEKMTKKLNATLSTTAFKNCPIVFVAAHTENNETENLSELVKIMSEYVFIPERNSEAEFLFSVDHCFGIKGQGTVMTGTVLQGSVQINDSVQIPSVNLTKKIKSMQMFRKPIQQAKQGDRIGICVTQFDPGLFERGIICTPDFATISNVAIINVQKINYFKFPIKTKSKFHISIGHETVMANITCFCVDKSLLEKNELFNFNLEYKYLDELCDDLNKDEIVQYLLLEFEKPVLTVPNCLVIGSKLDLDVNTSNCRLAFWGHLLEVSKDKNYKTTFLTNLKIYKNKSKEGIVERVVNGNEIIVKNMFQKDTNTQQLLNLHVTLSTGESGRIESQFGQSGKIKVYIPNGLKTETTSHLQSTQKKKSKDDTISKGVNVEPIKVNLHFKRYIYDSQKKIIQ